MREGSVYCRGRPRLLEGVRHSVRKDGYVQPDLFPLSFVYEFCCKRILAENWQERRSSEKSE